MPWEREVMYTVEDEEGNLLTLGEEELRRYADMRNGAAETPDSSGR